MSRRIRTPKRTYFIACEGINTEPLFFKYLEENLIDNDSLSIDIYPDKKDPAPKSDALSLVNLALENINLYDEVWVVFDKDGHDNLKDAFEKAAEGKDGKIVHVGYSSICFEYFLLLFFERKYKSFERCECKVDGTYIGCGMDMDEKDCLGDKCLIGYLRHSKLSENYSKKSKEAFKVINEIFVSVDIGNLFKNSEWLRYIIRNKKGLTEEKYELNPYVDIDLLVKELIKPELEYFWIGKNEEHDLNGYAISVHLEGNTFEIEIQNNSPQTYIINNTNIKSIFYFQKKNGSRVNFSLNENLVLIPGEKRSKRYTLSTNPEDIDYFIFRDRQKVLCVDLSD